ncbi:MAG TPA: DUF4440 domain-containing protein [Pyrinomonadaceae bacterium]
MKRTLVITIIMIAASSFAFGQGGRAETNDQRAVEQEVLRAERAQLDAYIKQDAAAWERLVADGFILTSAGNGVGGSTTTKEAMLDFLKQAPVDPTLTLTPEGSQVRIFGDTAIITGRMIERRTEDGRAGSSTHRYTSTWIKRGGRWQLAAEQRVTIPGQRTAVAVDPSIYNDYLGRYESPIFAFTIVREGDKLFAVADNKARPKIEIFPESESDFFAKATNVQMTFVRNRSGRVAYILVRMNGVDMRARRIA